MAEPEDDKNEAQEAEQDGSEDPPKKKKSKKLLLIVLPVLLLLGGAGGAYVMGVFGGMEDPAVAKKKAEEKARKEIVYYPVPEILVNLSGTGGKTHYLKIKVSLELANKTEIPKVEAVLPRIVDNFQVYLRELRVEDLRGSAGLYRLREELLARVNIAAAPAKVTDVLFKEMLVQ
ncbi:MAG TPA: flagellar basal body-associated FliL family protein [Alphaproteobacteria bacterium]|nr:flagellar basal body-associated FliL family protein [Alphaproteobacteria bacterium]